MSPRLEISNNLLLVLQDAPKRIFSTNSRSSDQPQNRRRKDTFCLPSIPFPRSFLQLQQNWHLYCFAILISTSTVIHSVKQRLLRNRPGSALRLPLATSFAKHYKAHSLQQTSFAESPMVRTHCQIFQRFYKTNYKYTAATFRRVETNHCQFKTKQLENAVFSGVGT